MHNNTNNGSHHRASLSPSPLADLGLSLSTAFPHPQPQRHPRARMGSGDSLTVSPMSSTTTSPTSSPISTSRRGMFHRGSGSRHHRYSGSTTDESDEGDRRSRSRSPFASHAAAAMSSLLRRRSAALFLLRHRPSAVDLALIEERSRCDEDHIERCGLDLMEPRPVDPLPVPPVDVGAEFGTDIFGDGSFDGIESRMRRGSSTQPSPFQQPRFVMGGIFEVMEGRA